jgi:hypothetical protein
MTDGARSGIPGNGKEETPEFRRAAFWRVRDRRSRRTPSTRAWKKLYRHHILKEPVPEGGFVPLGSITIAPAPAAPKKDETKEEVMAD